MGNTKPLDSLDFRHRQAPVAGCGQNSNVFWIYISHIALGLDARPDISRLQIGTELRFSWRQDFQNLFVAMKFSQPEILATKDF